jgi:hypothetical protein
MSKDISPKVLEIAEAMEKNATVDGNVIDPNFDKWCDDVMPENVTEEVIKTVRQFDSDMVAGCSLATGNIANKAMKDNAEIESMVTSKVDIFGNPLSVTYQRDFERRTSAPGEEPVMEKAHGKLMVNYRAKGTKMSTGDLSKVNKNLQAAASELFGDA